jgi:hypothetical protein
MNYYWKAIYKNGEVFSQYNADKTEERLYKDIERKRLEQFVLCQVNNDKPVYVLHFEAGQRLICRRRICRPLFMESIKEQETVWILGKQWLVENRCVKKLAFIFEDGHIEEKDDFIEPSKWYYPIIFDLEDKLDGVSSRDNQRASSYHRPT